jgi:hypothetical protein
VRSGRPLSDHTPPLGLARRDGGYGRIRDQQPSAGADGWAEGRSRSAKRDFFASHPTNLRGGGIRLLWEEPCPTNPTSGLGSSLWQTSNTLLRNRSQGGRSGMRQQHEDRTEVLVNHPDRGGSLLE